MGNYKKYILYSLYLIAFAAMVVVAYTSSKYRPESVSVLFTDFSWLGNWPKWLDLPLMPFLNEGFDKLIKEVKVEGQGGDDWVLVDAGDVIVHLMSSEAREFYDLESLWDPDL